MNKEYNSAVRKGIPSNKAEYILEALAAKKAQNTMPQVRIANTKYKCNLLFPSFNIGFHTAGCLFDTVTNSTIPPSSKSQVFGKSSSTSLSLIRKHSSLHCSHK